MALSRAEELVLDRFARKTAIAGGPKAGYTLRRQAILTTQGDHPGVDLEGGLAGLVERGLVKRNEAGTFYFLTAAGVERLMAGGERTPGTPGDT